MESISQEIIQIAKDCIGQEEIRGNLGFKDKDFQKKMEATGWGKGQAWCAYFGELVWKQAYDKYSSVIVDVLDDLFSSVAVSNFSHFKNAGWNIHTGKNPMPGSLAIWQTYHNGEKSWTGHLGVFVGLSDNGFMTIEGNTNTDGSREGYEVAEKQRAFNYSSINGLVLIGFIEPKIP